MSNQPLTNTNPAIVVIGTSIEQIDHELLQYNFPSDPGNVTPTLTVHKITTAAGLFALIGLGASATLPLVVLPNVNAYIRNSAEQYFGPATTMAKALSMVNNEYAIRRDQIINGTVKQTPIRRDY